MHTSEELRGKRILFIAPAFFGYHIDIIEEMKARGAVVDWLPDRPFNSSLAKGVTRFTPFLPRIVGVPSK